MIDNSPIVSLVKKVSPAVVSVIISKDLCKLQWPITGPAGLAEPLDKLEYLDKNHHKVKIGGGSGFLVSANGLILTNRHVVSDADAEYLVVDSRGKKYPAVVLARDSINDIAIIKISGSKLPFVKLGDSSKLQLGQTAVAIGNALGEFQNTVSVGVVSGLSRFITAQDMASEETKRLRGMVQTDTAINPGNSGGPLLDINGQAIGINAAVVFGAQSIGFSIPINTAKKDLAQLKRFGHLRIPTLGIRYILVNREISQKGNLLSDHGAWVLSEPGPNGYAVVPGSAAEQAKIKENDIVLEFNGSKISEDSRLEDMIAGCEVGQLVSLKVLSQGRERTVKVKLGERS